MPPGTPRRLSELFDMKARTRTTIIGAGFIAAALVVALLWMLGSGAQRNISMSFDGFTNFGPGNIAARFCLTNGTSAEVLFEVLSVESRSGKTWLPTSIGAGPGPESFDIGSMPAWIFGKTKWSGPLPRATSSTVLIPVSDTNTTYRVRFAGVEQRTRFDGMYDRFRELYAQLIERRSLNLFLGRRYEIASEEPSP